MTSEFRSSETLRLFVHSQERTAEFEQHKVCATSLHLAFFHGLGQVVRSAYGHGDDG